MAGAGLVGPACAAGDRQPSEITDAGQAAFANGPPGTRTGTIGSFAAVLFVAHRLTG
jgi:hypothetical protein